MSFSISKDGSNEVTVKFLGIHKAIPSFVHRVAIEYEDSYTYAVAPDEDIDPRLRRIIDVKLGTSLTLTERAGVKRDVSEGYDVKLQLSISSSGDICSAIPHPDHLHPEERVATYTIVDDPNPMTIHIVPIRTRGWSTCDGPIEIGHHEFAIRIRAKRGVASYLVDLFSRCMAIVEKLAVKIDRERAMAMVYDRSTGSVLGWMEHNLVFASTLTFVKILHPVRLTIFANESDRADEEIWDRIRAVSIMRGDPPFPSGERFTFRGPTTIYTQDVHSSLFEDIVLTSLRHDKVLSFKIELGEDTGLKEMYCTPMIAMPKDLDLNSCDVHGTASCDVSCPHAPGLCVERLCYMDVMEAMNLGLEGLTGFLTGLRESAAGPSKRSEGQA